MRRLPRSARFICGVLVFAILGPPVGGLMAWLGMGAATLRSPLPFVAGSWLEGGALALATGLLTAIAAWRGATSWTIPVAAAALVTAVFVAATAGGDWAAMLRTAPVLMPPAIVASFVCWLLTRRSFRDPRAADDGPSKFQNSDRGGIIHR
jgi:hypothetical protein